MPKIHFVKKARKDNPAVKAGAPYYWWKPRYGRKRYSATRPRPSQLVSSGKLATFLEQQELVDDWFTSLTRNVRDFADLAEAIQLLEDADGALREVADEYRESADNQAEYFGETEQVLESQEKADALDQVADTLQAAADAIGGIDDQTACEACDGTGECQECDGHGNAECDTCGGSAYDENECYTCAGYGTVHVRTDTENYRQECDTCGGSGLLETDCEDCFGEGQQACSTCDGSGECQECNGSGKVDWDEDTLRDHVGQAYEMHVDWSDFYWV